MSKLRCVVREGKRVLRLFSAWDESKHPRHPTGSKSGGEFAPRGEVTVGASVTRESPYWYDKTPVAGWPTQQQRVGIVTKIGKLLMPYNTGVYVAVRYPGGLKERHRLDDMYLVKK